MRHWPRPLIQVLLALALLWQSSVAIPSTLAGCCEGEQPCCVALRADQTCLSCFPVITLAADARWIEPRDADPAPQVLATQTQRETFLHDIWRPPKSAD